MGIRPPSPSPPPHLPSPASACVRSRSFLFCRFFPIVFLITRFEVFFMRRLLLPLLLLLLLIFCFIIIIILVVVYLPCFSSIIWRQVEALLPLLLADFVIPSNRQERIVFLLSSVVRPISAVLLRSTWRCFCRFCTIVFPLIERRACICVCCVCASQIAVSANLSPLPPAPSTTTISPSPCCSFPFYFIQSLLCVVLLASV